MFFSLSSLSAVKGFNLSRVDCKSKMLSLTSKSSLVLIYPEWIVNDYKQSKITIRLKF